MAAGRTPLLQTMSKAARTAWPFIQSAAAQGLGSEAIIAAMRAGGIDTFRRQDMLALIREASGAELLKSDVIRWPSNSILPFERVRKSVTKIVAPFSYTLKVTGIDGITGERLTILRQAHSYQLMSADEIQDIFMESAQGFEQYAALEIEDAQVIDIQRAGTAGFL